MSAPVFRFRLERIRAVRERKEKLAKQELAARVSRRAQLPGGASHQRRPTSSTHAPNSAPSPPTPAAVSAIKLQARQAFLERVRGPAPRAAPYDLEQREAEVADRDAKLTTAASEHEMLNRLRERRRREHEREASRCASTTCSTRSPQRASTGAR